MKQNLFMMYSDSEHQRAIASSMIAFGAGVFKRAKIIRGIDELQRIKDGMENGTISPQESKITEFIFEYLVDCVRVLIFFENYMKALLIVNDYCVHEINKDTPGFADLAKNQKSRPIKLIELHTIESFEIDKGEETIFHRAVKETTLGVSILTGSQDYLAIYKLEKDVLDFIKQLNKNRNKLHFNHSLEFSLSQDLIDKFKKLNDLVDRIFTEGLTF